MTVTEENWRTARNPISLQLCLSQIPHRMGWDGTQNTTFSGLPLTTRTMALAVEL